ncbi:MAG: DUF2270 domain-containing protein [Planctomycetota bacterium]
MNEPEPAGDSKPGRPRVNALTHRFPPENLNVLSHFYRGELSRSNVWRQKMDMTTNWAVITTTALVSVAYGNPQVTHLVLLFGSALVFLLLNIEGRRYRFFDLWRTRVRMLEVHFMVPAVYHEKPLVEGNWREVLCNDLLAPSYKISYWEAVGRRLHRNYIYIFLILLMTWLIKVVLHRPVIDGVPVSIYEGFAVPGLLPPWFVIALAAAFHVGVLTILFATARVREATGEVRRKDPNRRLWPV